MLRQLVVGSGVSICNIVIHALVMTALIPVVRTVDAKKTGHPTVLLIFVMVATVSVLMAAHMLEVLVLGAGICDRRRCASGCRSRVLRIGQLHHAWLWRCNADGALAPAWSDDGDERRVAVRLVDRGYFPSAA